jgi:hypothetical protein
MNTNKKYFIAAAVALIILLLMTFSKKNKEPVEPVSVPATAAQTEEITATVTEKTPTPTTTPSPSATPPPPLPPPSKEANVEKVRAFAKATLSSLYAAQRAFHSEKGRYSTDLKALGWAPGDRLLTYKMGFVEAFQPEKKDSGEVPEDMSTDSFMGHVDPDTNKEFAYHRDVQDTIIENYRGLCQDHCTASTDNFEVMLVIPIGKGREDVWLINSNKELRLVKDGTTEK